METILESDHSNTRAGKCYFSSKCNSITHVFATETGWRRAGEGCEVRETRKEAARVLSFPPPSKKPSAQAFMFVSFVQQVFWRVDDEDLTIFFKA